MASSSSNSIREEYLSSLADLDQNSKPMIDMLTMLAEDHRQHAPIIVDCIKQRLAQVRVKLPLLYLIDSIVKNVGDPYKQLFQQEIVGMFVDAFDKSKTDKVREKMFALRETWNDVFLQTKLYALDVKVNQIDQNWPIVAKVVTKNPKIHVNPNFLKKQMEPVDPIEQLQQELREKHRKLLELKNCKLELEMREMAKKIEEEQKKSSSSTANVVPSTSGMKSTVKVSPVGSALLDSVVGGVAAAASSSTVTAVSKGSRTASASSTKNDKNKDGKSSSSSSSRKSSSTSPKSSSKSKSGSSSSSSHRSSSNHHSGSKDRKRSSKRSSDESTEKSPSKRSRSSGSESVDGDKKAKHAAVMAKRIPKLAAGVTTTSTGDTDERIVSSTATSSTSPLKGATTIEGQAANQKHFLDAAAMDVDLRQFVGLPATTTTMDKEVEISTKGDTDERKIKARPQHSRTGGSVSAEDSEGDVDAGPLNKKFDMLFGSNDVDLRSIGGAGRGKSIGATSQLGINEKEATLGWSKIKGDTPKRGAVPKTNFEAIKSRIQEASKAKKKRFDDRIIERQPQLQDVDLRTPLGQPGKRLDVDDTSQDALDSSIRTIMEQAQEQLDNQAITQDQYQTMVQQVIQLNETKKIKEAERIENKHNGSVEDLEQSSSDSDSEEDVRDFRRKKAERRSHFNNRSQENSGNSSNGKSSNSRWQDNRRSQQPVQPWENNNNNNMGMQRPPANWRGMPPGFGPRNAWANGPGAGRFAGPRFNNRMPPFAPQMTHPPPHGLPNQLQSSLMNSQSRPARDAPSTIKIDNVNREIRFYGDVAIVFMNWDQPKEIGFQPGTRRITCDDQWSMNLSFNAPNVAWMIDGRPHQVRLGAPTRELYIDNEWYECYIGDPIRVELGGKMRTLVVEGPPPQVRIGEYRGDLVAGMINIIIDAKAIVPVYLDSSLQYFEVDGVPQTLQFADYFLTVLLNKEPIPVEFGGLPKSFYVNGQKHFMRFTALPRHVVPGQFFVQGMLRTPEKRHIPSPPPVQQGLHVPPPPQMPSLLLSHPPPPVMLSQMPPQLSIPPPTSNLSNGLDMLTNILPGLASPQIPLFGGSSASEPPSTGGYNLENNGQSSTGSAAPANPLGNVNVNDLFQKLLATGILGKSAPAAEKNNEAVKESVPATKEKKTDGNQRKNYRKGGNQQNRGKDSGKENAKASSAPILTKDKIVPVDLAKPASIKARQLAIVQEVYLGMQCSSCGVRFPPEQTVKYSQHLDWHFRQNRRDRDSARKAHSRKWYYDVNNWIQYEEIEDLEEREKNWFETQQSEDAGPDETNPQGDGAMPSCPAGSTEGEKICEVCHEPFDQFYNEETEEWHLRPAIRVEELIYHPICYEDYKLSLTLDESKMSEAVKDDPEEVKQEQDVKTEGEAEEESTKMDQSTDNDDDVIVLPMDAPSITEILDDDEEEGSNRSPKPAAEGDSNGEASMDVVVDTSKIAMPMPGVVRIKTEPNDDGYNEEDAFMDVGTIEPIDDEPEEEEDPPVEEQPENGESSAVPEEPKEPVQEEEETVLTVDTSEGNPEGPETIALDSPMTPATGIPTQIETPELGLEGNGDLLESAAPVVSIVPNKIKINISKAVSAAVHAEGNTDSRDSVQSGGLVGAGENSSDVVHGENKTSRPATPEVEIEYTLKETMQEVTFQKMGKVANGVETSGLCSIM